MRYYSAFLILFAVILIGCASTAHLPSTLNIVPPAPHVPPEIAAFSGRWEGMSQNSRDIILVVEKININEAEIIISFGDLFNYEGAYHYYIAKVMNDFSIEFTHINGDKTIFTMNKELNEIKGIFIEKKTGSRRNAILHKRK
jgi:hypothetical protein